MLNYNITGSAIVYLGALSVYNLSNGTWHRIGTAAQQAGPPVPASDNLRPGGALPFSQSTRHLFTVQALGSSFRHIPLLEPDVNPYWAARQTNTRTVQNVHSFASNATCLLPAWDLPNLEGWPSIVTRITCAGDIDAGGTAATAAYVRVYVFPPGTAVDAYDSIDQALNNVPYVEFGTGNRQRSQPVNWGDHSMFYKLQLGIQLARTTADTNYTPNALPIIVEGYTFIRAPDPPPTGLQFDGWY